MMLNMIASTLVSSTIHRLNKHQTVKTTRFTESGGTWETTKDSVVDTYEGLKYTVKKNMIMSICIGTAILGLLLLCCYLRCKHSRPSETMTKRQHDKLLEDRQARSEMNEKNRKKNRRRKENRSATKLDQDSPNNLSNNSFETRATILSDTQNYFHDVENGGIEIELDDNKVDDHSISPVKGEYLESESPQRKPLFAFYNKKDKREI